MVKLVSLLVFIVVIGMICACAEKNNQSESLLGERIDSVPAESPPIVSATIAPSTQNKGGVTSEPFTEDFHYGVIQYEVFNSNSNQEDAITASWRFGSMSVFKDDAGLFETQITTLAGSKQCWSLSSIGSSSCGTSTSSSSEIEGWYFTERSDTPELVSLVIPKRTEVSSREGILSRINPVELQLTSSNNNELFIGNLMTSGKRFHLVDSDGDGVNDLIDSAIGDEHGLGIVVGVRKSQNIKKQELAGDYGFVGVDAMIGRRTAFVYRPPQLITSGFGLANSNSKSFYTIGRMRVENDILHIEENQNNPEKEVFGLTTDGQLITVGTQAPRGYVSPGGDVIVYFGRQGEKNNNKGFITGSGVTMGVKLPERLPILEGGRYRLFELSIGLGQGDVHLNTRISGALAFTESRTIKLTDLQAKVIDYDVDTGQLISSLKIHPDIEEVPVSYADNGLVSFNAINSSGQSTQYSGYVSNNGNLIILRKLIDPYDQKSMVEGLVIAVRQ